MCEISVNENETKYPSNGSIAFGPNQNGVGCKLNEQSFILWMKISSSIINHQLLEICCDKRCCATQINVKQKNEEFKWKKKNKHDTLLSDGFMWPINTIVLDVCVLKEKKLQFQVCEWLMVFEKWFFSKMGQKHSKVARVSNAGRGRTRPIYLHLVRPDIIFFCSNVLVWHKRVKINHISKTKRDAHQYLHPNLSLSLSVAPSQTHSLCRTQRIADETFLLLPVFSSVILFSSPSTS